MLLMTIMTMEIKTNIKVISMKFNSITFSLLIIVLILIISACTSGDETIKVTFEGVNSQHKWALSDLNPDLPADWSSYEYLTFDMQASTAQTVLSPDIRCRRDSPIGNLACTGCQDTCIHTPCSFSGTEYKGS
jgi:hypothetical protein